MNDTFDFRVSMWDNVVLELLRKGYSSESAITSANEIVAARDQIIKTGG